MIAEEKFKEVVRAYEEIMGTHDGSPPPSADAHAHAHRSDTAPEAPGAPSVRRAGSAPAQAQPVRAEPIRGTAGGSLFSSADCDMRVFTDTVALEDMVEDPDEDGFVLECRCSGLFVLLWDDAAAEQLESEGMAAVNCRLCSLWIWVSVGTTAPPDGPLDVLPRHVVSPAPVTV